MGVDHAVWLHQPLLQGGHQHQRLDGRAGFKGVADGAITKIVQRGTLAVVGIEIRVVGHRQDLPSLDVDQHRCPRLRFIPGDSIVQRIFRDGLQPLINAQLDVMRRNGRHFGNIFDHASEAILTHAAQAGFAGELRVKTFLDPFDALAVDIGKADQVSRHVSGRVKTARLITQADTRQPEFGDPLGLSGIHLAGQIDKTAMWIAVDARRKRGERQMQCTG